MEEKSKTQTEILAEAFTVRQREFDGYQMNIDNYQMSIEHIDEMPDGEEKSGLADFRSELEARLAAEKREQAKIKVLMAVLEKRIESLSAEAAE